MQKDLKDALFMFAVSNSCVNPLVYGSYTMNFRGHFRRWIALLCSANVRSPWSTSGSGSRSGASNLDSLNSRKSAGGVGRSRNSGGRGGGAGLNASKKNRYIHEVENTTSNYSHISPPSPLSVSMSLADHVEEEEEEAVVVEKIITSRQIGSLSTRTPSSENVLSHDGVGGAAKMMLITTTTEAIIVQNAAPGTSYSSS